MCHTSAAHTCACAPHRRPTQLSSHAGATNGTGGGAGGGAATNGGGAGGGAGATVAGVGAGEFNEAIVFVVGGGCYTEYHNLQEFGKVHTPFARAGAC